MATFWIGQDYLVEKSVIDSNAEYKKIEPVIELVQDKYILPILGTRLYGTINTHILAYINSSTVIPTAYQYLLDNYILKMLVYYIMYESSPTFKYRYTNKGIMVKSSENSQPASQAEVEYNMNIWKLNGELYGGRLIKYLEANISSYPTYRTEVVGEVFPESTTLDVDVYLGDRRKYPLTNDSDI